MCFRCAAEASEKIAAAFDGSSGHSSGAEEEDSAHAAAVAAAADATEVASRTTRSGRVSKPVKVRPCVGPKGDPKLSHLVQYINNHVKIDHDRRFQ